MGRRDSRLATYSRAAAGPSEIALLPYMQEPILVLDPAASGRIVVKLEVMAQISSSGDYFRLARHSGTIPIGPPVSCEEVTST